MAEEKNNPMDRKTSSGEEEEEQLSVLAPPERKKSKYQKPSRGGDVEPHNHDKAESGREGGDRWESGSDIQLRSSKVREDSGRERLKRHRVEVAGSVWIPEIWGQEELMKDWIDCSVFDASLVTSRIMSARAALMADGRRHTNSSTQLRIENRCKIFS